MTVSDLKPEWRVQLERLGVEGVRLVLLQQGRDATVQLWPQVADSPRRSDVEDWLETQLDKQDRRNTSGFARFAATRFFSFGHFEAVRLFQQAASGRC